MEYLSYLAAHQLAHRLTAEQFTPGGEPSAIESPPRPKLRALRAALASLLRHTADRVEPVGVTS